MSDPQRNNQPLTLETAPITRTTLALFAGGSADHNPMHIDIDVAKSAGLDDVFAHGMLSMAYLGRVLTDNFALRDIKRFKVRFTAITNVGEAVTCRAVGERVADGVTTLALEARASGAKLTLSGEADISI